MAEVDLNNPPKIRYDEWTEFHNPTTKDFVGKWDGEEYLIGAGKSATFPVWLARHFAKRLCDDEMIKRFRVPLKPEAPERKEFMAKCLNVDLDDIDTSPQNRKISVQQQINEDRAVQEGAQPPEEQGEVLSPSTEADIPIGDDELPAQEPVDASTDTTNASGIPPSEEQLQQEVAQENTDAGKGIGNFGKNPIGAAETETEFEGDVSNIPPVQPPGIGGNV